MNATLPRLAGAAATLALLVAATGAEAAGTRYHAIGMDMVRLIDNGQFEPDDGTLNLFYQGYLTQTTAWTIGYAWGERSDIPEFTYKIYNQAYQAGTFWQVGVASVDVEDSVYDNDLAVLGAFGFERMPADNLVISGAVKALVGIDHPDTGEKDIVFLPSLSVIFAF